MAFEGALEDLAFVDVVQLLHVSHKSGTLHLHQGERQATVVFREGLIVGANHPDAGRSIGVLLTEQGAIQDGDIVRALELQRADSTDRRGMVQILVDLGLLDAKVGYAALARLVEETVVEVVEWVEGFFVFELGDITTTDEFRHVPGCVGGELSLDTQHVLMEALQIVDERNRVTSAERVRQSRTSSVAPAHVALPEASKDQAPSQAPAEVAGETPRPGAVPPTPNAVPVSVEGTFPSAAQILESAGSDTEDPLLAAIDGIGASAVNPDCLGQLLVHSADPTWAQELVEQAGRGGFEAHAIQGFDDLSERLLRWQQAGLQGATVIDLAAADPQGSEEHAIAMLGWLRARYPAMPLLALARQDDAQIAELYRLGADTVISRAIAGQLGADPSRAALAWLPGALARHGVMARQLIETGRQMHELRQRLHAICHQRGSADVSLNVLQYVAEFFERCVIFLVRQQDLRGLGAFGVDENGETLSSAVSRLSLPRQQGSLIEQVLRHGTVFHGTSEDPVLWSHLYLHVGAPESPTVLLLPLQADGRTVALVYGDFGTRAAGPIQTDALEIIASASSLALELALHHRVAEPSSESSDQTSAAVLKLVRSEV